MRDPIICTCERCCPSAIFNYKIINKLKRGSYKVTTKKHLMSVSANAGHGLIEEDSTTTELHSMTQLLAYIATKPVQCGKFAACKKRIKGMLYLGVQCQKLIETIGLKIDWINLEKHETYCQSYVKLYEQDNYTASSMKKWLRSTNDLMWRLHDILWF